MEDLLDSGFEYVITSYHESDPVNRRFGVYYRMSGGVFLVLMRLVEKMLYKVKELSKQQAWLKKVLTLLINYRCSSKQ